MATCASPLFAVFVALPFALAGEGAWAKGPKLSSSTAKSVSKPKPAVKESSRPDINIDLSSRGGSSQPSTANRSAASGAAGGAAAAGAGAAGAAIAPGGPKESPEEVRKRIAEREDQLKAVADEKAKRRADDEKLAALAARDREQKAAAAEVERAARQKRAQQALGSTGGCVFKPVMTDADIAACRK